MKEFMVCWVNFKLIFQLSTQVASEENNNSEFLKNKVCVCKWDPELQKENCICHDANDHNRHNGHHDDKSSNNEGMNT